MNNDTSPSELITLEWFTNDPVEQEIVRLYWRIDEKSLEFSMQLSHLHALCRRSKKNLIDIVRTAARATALCARCHAPTVVASRSSINASANALMKRFEGHLYCGNCCQIERQMKQAGIEQEYQLAVAQADQAFTEKRYEHLSRTAYNYLLLLSSHGTDAVRARLGLTEAQQEEILDSLLAQQLIARKPHYGKAGYYAPVGYGGLPVRTAFHAIFAENGADQQMMNWLKNENVFVFPFMPLSIILRRETIADLLVEPWQVTCFDTEQVAFVACNAKGIPESVFDRGAVDDPIIVFKKQLFTRVDVSFYHIH